MQCSHLWIPVAVEMSSRGRRRIVPCIVQDILLAILLAMGIGAVVFRTQGSPCHDRAFLETLVPALATLLGFVGAILAIVFPGLHRPISRLEHQIQRWARVEDDLKRGRSEAELEQIVGQLPWYVLTFGTGPIKQRVAMYLADLTSNRDDMKTRYRDVLSELVVSAMSLTVALVVGVLHLKLLSAASFGNLINAAMSMAEMVCLVFSTALLIIGLIRSAEMAS